jgi:hypothetical protein
MTCLLRASSESAEPGASSGKFHLGFRDQRYGRPADSGLTRMEYQMFRCDPFFLLQLWRPPRMTPVFELFLFLIASNFSALMDAKRSVRGRMNGATGTIKKELRALGNSANESIIYEAVLGSLRNGFGGHELCLR